MSYFPHDPKREFRLTVLGTMLLLASMFAIAALGGCVARVEPDTTCQSVVVKVPVATCPVPPVLTPPHEFVYDLDGSASPDEIEKAQEATILELESSLGECSGYLDAYRSIPSPVPTP